jgi:hypothetical protein
VFRIRCLPILASVTALVGLALFAAPVSATRSARDQNPQLAVVASVTPNHAPVGSTVLAVGSVRNTTSSPLVVQFNIELSTPTGRVLGKGTSGTLAPGDAWHLRFRRLVTQASAGGTFLLHVVASDKLGRSHASAHASVP